MSELWYTDRTRYQTWFRCPRERYLRFHAEGHGIERISRSLALSTGSAVHRCLEAIVRLGASCAPEQASQLITTEVEAFRSEAAARGLEGRKVDPNTLEEQSSMITGLAYAWYRTIFPDLLADFEVLHIEQEFSIKLGGLVLNTKPDLVLRRRRDGKLGIHDYKTSAYQPGDKELSQWETDLQPLLYCAAVQTVLGEPVDHYYIHSLVKGARRSTTDIDEVGRPTTTWFDDSPLHYGWYQAFPIPGAPGDWKPLKKWQDPTTLKWKQLPSTYSRRLIPYKEVFAWVDSLPRPTLTDRFRLMGPFSNRAQYLATHLQQELPAVESRVLLGVEAVNAAPPSEQESVLNLHFPRSYNCSNSYNGEKCGYYHHCILHRTVDGKPDPSVYQLRSPHTQLEKSLIER